MTEFLLDLYTGSLKVETGSRGDQQVRRREVHKGLLSTWMKHLSQQHPDL